MGPDGLARVSRSAEGPTARAAGRALMGGLMGPGRVARPSRLVRVATIQAVPRMAQRPGAILALRAEQLAAPQTALPAAMA